MSDTKTITIAGVPFDVTTPFAEGHACSEAEARALNQTRCENIRNNMAKVVKENQDDEGQISDEAMAALVAKVTEYDTAYVFTIGNTGTSRTAMDPVEKMARKIAREVIAAALSEAGRKITDVDKEKLATAVALKAEDPAIVKLATRRIADRSKNAEAALEGLDL